MYKEVYKNQRSLNIRLNVSLSNRYEKAVANRIGDVKANFSASSKEVLVVGHVPSNKLSYVNEKVDICKREGEYFENR